MANFFTKLASTVSIATLVAASTSASFVSAASEFLPYAEALADNGTISTQSTEAGYRLGANITRAELAKVVANLGEFTPTSCAGDVYSDVNSTLGDLCGYVEALAEAGVVSTSNATYRPNANVTRAEAVKLILGALGETGSDVAAGYTDVAALGDLTSYINRANEIGVIGDATYFRPNASITRGEAFKIAAATAQLDVGTVDGGDTGSTGGDTGSTTTSGSTTTTGSVVAGNLTVALDGQAVAQYVPKNASNVKVGSVKLTAGTTDVSVNSITVLRSGLGDSAGLTVAVAQSGLVISENRSVNTSTQEGIIRLNSTLVVKAGTSVVVDILASVATSANSQHQFAVKAVGTTATVTGAPVTLGLVNTTDYEVSKVKVLAGYVDMNSSVTSGKNDQSLGTVKLQAGNKDVTLSAFTLTKNSGTDLTRMITNVKVYKNAVQVGTASVTSDKIYVTALNTKVARNDTATFELRADVIHVGSNENLTIGITDTTDVSGTEDLTGYATQTDLPVNGVTDTLGFGALDIVWTKNTTKSVTVAPGASSVVLFDAKITSSATFDVTKFTLKGQSTNAAALTGGSLASNFTSLTLTVNGVDYDLLNTSGFTTAPLTFAFSKTSDKFRMDAGTPVAVKLVANLSNSANSASYTFNVSLNDVKNVSNGNVVTGLNKDITGDQVTVEAPTLTIKASTVAAPSTSKIYSNASALEIGRFGVEAKAEEITVREVTLTNSSATNAVNDFTKLVSGTNVKLVNVADGAQVSASVTVNAGEIKLTGMNIKVAKDTTSNFKVVVDTQGDLTSTFTSTGNKLMVTAYVPSASSSSVSNVVVSPYTTTKEYTVSVIPPTVTLTKKSSNVYLVKITNADADQEITLNSITAQVRPVSVANNNYSATTCLRDEGSSDKCDVATSTGSVPGAAKEFVIVGGVKISKNSNITREIYVDSNFVSPADLQGEITSIKYNTGITETYSVVAQ